MNTEPHKPEYRWQLESNDGHFVVQTPLSNPGRQFLIGVRKAYPDLFRYCHIEATTVTK
ncbi:MAG: hypothetical protein GY938_30780 [Ketobacter sp.]|nr:hypothetical protein [Ketobacter sp.]